MSLSRRRFLVGVAGTAACARLPDPLAGELLGHDAAALGHRVRDGASAPPKGASDRVDVLIVGGGVAGLSAAWRLRAGGFGGSVRIVELDDALGGTARSGASGVTAYPWGAHYVTLPSREARHVRALLTAFGAIVGEDAEGRPRYHPRMLCAAPQERLFAGDRWLPGLWEDVPVDAEGSRQREAFSEACAAWRARTGADGLPAFAIPVATCSLDGDIRALATASFAAWLDAQGFTDPVLRAACRYATRDDYGAEPEQVSAWAGLHYFCARRPFAAELDELGTDVLAWPAGNGWLVDRLAEGARAERWTGALVRRVDADATGVRADVETSGESREIRASYAILAVPPRIADRLRGRSPDPVWPDLAPWRVANLHVSALPTARGVPTAWDSVVAGAEGLGYVTATHQALGFRGPSVLTWYMPLSRGSPSAGRAELLAAEWASEAEIVLAELAPAHPDLRGVIERLDVRHWGHGTAIPAIGVHTRALPTGTEARVSRAHATMSGLSLFEEASWHGIRAGEEALAALGVASGTML